MARKLVVEIVGDAASLERAFKKSSRSANTFGRTMEKTQTKSRRAFGGIGRMAGFAAGAIGTAGLIGVARSAFAEFSDAQKVMAQTTAVLKSTGEQANVSAKHVETLADSMLKLTGIDDEATQAAENWLLSFRNVRNELGKGNKIFDRATRAVADLATAQADGAVPSSEQMVQASKLVGKALDDPIRGLTALRRAGIGFTEQQKEKIKSLVEEGKSLQAQKVILDEVTKQVGGRAAAAGKTFAGQWRILVETLNNLTGVLAAKLMPTIQKYLEMAVRWISNSQNQKKIIDAVSSAASALKSVFDTLVGAFKILSKIVGGNKNAIIALVAAYATFKAVQIASTVMNLASSFGLLARRTNGAKTASQGLTASFLGKAGLVAAVGLASFQITSMILKMTKLDKKLRDFGAKVADIASDLGLIANPEEAERKAIARVAKKTGISKRRLGRLVEGPGAGRMAPLQVNVQLDGRTIATATAPHNESALARRRKQRAHQRRSTR